MENLINSKGIQQSIEDINWFHNYDIETFGFKTNGRKGGCGDVNHTNLGDVIDWRLTPEMFKDRTVLDIGAWDGYFSFYAEKMGAKRVLACDHPSWSGPCWGTKDGFNLVHQLLNSNVESLDIDLYNLEPEKLGTFETVLFLGVLYHLDDPLGGLRKAASMANNLFIVETTSEEHDADGKPYTKNDPMFITNTKRFESTKHGIYSINVARIEELFQDLGFTKIKFKWYEDNHRANQRIICYAER